MCGGIGSEEKMPHSSSPRQYSNLNGYSTSPLSYRGFSHSFDGSGRPLGTLINFPLSPQSSQVLRSSPTQSTCSLAPISGSTYRHNGIACSSTPININKSRTNYRNTMMQSMHNNHSVDSAMISPNLTNMSPNFNAPLNSSNYNNSNSSGSVDLSKTALLIREVSFFYFFDVSQSYKKNQS